jgi:hypothetical protein
MNNQDFHTMAAAIFTAPAFKANATAELLAGKVDRLGALAAYAASIKKEADELRAELEAAALASIEGHHYRATFSQCKGRTATDWQAVAAKFKPSAQLIRAHTTTGSESTRMTIKAHPTH